MAKTITKASSEALKNFNSDHGTSWSFGTNWTNVNKEFETFLHDYLFPKINATYEVTEELGNRFDWLAKEVDFIGQYSEEYVILDSIPVGLNLSKPEELMLKRNYPKMATKLYGPGIVKKQKFTLNNNDSRLSFQTLGDATAYALSVYRKKISDINAEEEREIKAMLLDYATRNVAQNRRAMSYDDMVNEIYTAMLNMQNNSELYNEANTASGGSLARYTTVSALEDLVILTTDAAKVHVLNSHIANSFHIEGMDFTKNIISFDNLGGVYRLTKDVTIKSQDTLDKFRAFGDYQIQSGDKLFTDTVLTFDPKSTDFATDSYTEIKADTDFFAYVFDLNKLKYRRYTRNLLKEPFYNGEFDEITYWIHYYSFKSMSPFYNSILIH